LQTRCSIANTYTAQEVLELYTDSNGQLLPGFTNVADNLPNYKQYLDLIRDCITVFRLPKLPKNQIEMVPARYRANKLKGGISRVRSGGVDDSGMSYESSDEALGDDDFASQFEQKLYCGDENAFRAWGELDFVP
jgi:hypothetical protein